MGTPSISLLILMANSSPLTHLRILFFFLTLSLLRSCDGQLLVGFKATPNPSATSFQSLLTDSTGNFSLGFLRVNSTQLVLSVIHLPSSEPVWQANPTRPARWSGRTELSFNGSLVISDPSTGVLWSTDTKGDRLVLLNTSNLQVRDTSTSVVLWQSFDFPTNTLVENQNFTSAMALASSNGLYTMRLGDIFMGLYAKFGSAEPDQIYWKHTAMQAKADIIEGNGPIHARVNPVGFLGLYQNMSSVAVDVQPFSSFQRGLTGYLIVRLEGDGNLKGYFWDGSTWILDYQAIADTCELPSTCGPYGLCTAGAGCSCLENKTSTGDCLSPVKGGPDLCGEKGSRNDDFWVLRRKGVEVPYKELMGYETTSSLQECERLCESNCSCWGAVYNNASGFCYRLDRPVQTLVGVGDETKVGYFKVRVGAGKRMETRVKVGFGLAVLGGVLLILIGVKSWMIWRRRRKGVKSGSGIPGPYKDLNTASFRSIEISNNTS